jgi:hypothetical protein
LETGADGVAADRGDADQIGAAQPVEGGLEAGDPFGGGGIVELGHRGEVRRVGRIADRCQVQPG